MKISDNKKKQLNEIERFCRDAFYKDLSMTPEERTIARNFHIVLCDFLLMINKRNANYLKDIRDCEREEIYFSESEAI